MPFTYSRKSSPPTRSRTSARASGFGRRRTLRTLATYLVGGVAIVLFFIWIFSGVEGAPKARDPNAPEIVIVTVFDPKLSKVHVDSIKENRRDYARRHGYATFFPSTADYDLTPGVPQSWSTLPALRHAMTNFPDTPWIFYLSATALIMNPSENLYNKIINPDKLESMMIFDQPVVPPDSIIRTFKQKPERVDFILAQDVEGLAGGSFLLRTGEWAKYFLDAWFDPLYRSYNFQKAEGHALEHIVQWHGTILTKLALVPQRVLNSYAKSSRFSGGIYQEGDFVVNFHGCHRDPERNCEGEMAPLMSRWRELRDKDRHGGKNRQGGNER